MMLAEPIAVALQVGQALDALGVAWLVGGSVASSLHGIPRATQDIDLVADLDTSHIAPLVDALQAEFYIDADMIRDAIRRRAAFNLIHLATMTKVDIFILGRDLLSTAEMSRRLHIEIDEQGHHLPLASPEDIILQKLDWYRRGEHISERQWRDVLGVLKVRGQDLDLAYLREQATAAGLAELLDSALEASHGR